MNLGRKRQIVRVAMIFVAIVASVSGAISNESCSTDLESISAGSQHTLGLLKNGSIVGWGFNFFGQIGASDNKREYSLPTVIKEGKWIQVFTKASCSFGILNDGTLWAWGNNGYGQMGDGTKDSRELPIQIGNENDWLMIAPGTTHTLALKKDGSLWAWGTNSYGQLGTGNKVDSWKPTKIETSHKWSKIFAGNDFSFAIHEDGTLWAWGSNDFGQLGDNTKESRLSPVQIAPEIKWKKVSGGEDHTIALDVDGKLYAWGNNTFGQLGDGTTNDVYVPQRIGDGIWKAISAGFDNSFGIFENGALYAWGCNKDGELGVGDKEVAFYPNPVQIGKEFTWKSISAGSSHTTGITTEGYTILWGENAKGQLGNGDASKKYVLSPSLCSGNQGFCFQGTCQNSSCPESYFADLKRVCIQCEKGLYFDSKSKTCVDKCDSSCKTCEGLTTKCTTCEGSFYLNEKHECIGCDSNCKTCEVSPTNCTSCEQGYLHSPTNNTCQKEPEPLPSDSCSGFLCPLPLVITFIIILIVALVVLHVRRTRALKARLEEEEVFYRELQKNLNLAL